MVIKFDEERGLWVIYQAGLPMANSTTKKVLTRAWPEAKVEE